MTGTHTDGCGSDVAAYALGALPDDDARRFEAHLRTCHLCRTDLASLRPVVDALPAAADAVAPPPALKKRIMGVVETEARERRRERERAARPRRTGRRLGFVTLRPLPAVAAACALVLAGVGIGVAVLQDGATTVDGQCIRGCERVAMSVDDGHGTLKVEGMAQPPAGRVYQVWTQRFGEDPRPTDALFTVDKDGSASVDVPADTGRVDQVLVTDEPPGGSPAPSTAPYLAVRI
ncbi:MAG TPA: anti-sigma factor [Solirubrobacteraceae bacterium]|nr:anti-sigma factor [Solirubrobacteraceae bacterium]